MQAALARITVSEKLNTAVATRTKRKFTDMVPVMPGRRTFNADVRSASAK